MSAPNSLLPAVPPGPLLPWVLQHPEQVAAYLETVRALARLEIVVVQAGVTKKFPLVLSAENAVVKIDL